MISLAPPPLPPTIGMIDGAGALCSLCGLGDFDSTRTEALRDIIYAQQRLNGSSDTGLSSILEAQKIMRAVGLEYINQYASAKDKKVLLAAMNAFFKQVQLVQLKGHAKSLSALASVANSILNKLSLFMQRIPDATQPRPIPIPTQAPGMFGLDGLGILEPFSLITGILGPVSDFLKTKSQEKIAKKQLALQAAELKAEKEEAAREYALTQAQSFAQGSVDKRRDQTIVLAAVGGAAVLISALLIVGAMKARRS